MAYPAANRRGPVEVIDLTSDGLEGNSPIMHPQQPVAPQLFHDVDDDLDYLDLAQTPPPAARRQDGPNPAILSDESAQGGFYVEIDGENVFIPDEPAEAVDGAVAPPAADANIFRDLEIAMGMQQPEEAVQNFQQDNAGQNEDVQRDREMALAFESQEVTADTCLQRVLEIFPDISHQYVIKLYEDLGKEGDYETLPGQGRLDNIIEQLADNTSYPKQDRGKLKRKRKPSIAENDNKKWEQQDRALLPRLHPQIRSMLKAEFPAITVQYINATLKTHQHLYHAYLALAKAQDNSQNGTRPFGRGRPSNVLTDASTIAMATGHQPLLDELNAARAKVQSNRLDKALEEAKQQAEKENLEKAIAAGETSECSACFDDLPMNRQIHCNGPVAHFTCYDCALTYIKSEIGESRCRVLCTAGCGAAFANDQLNQLSDKQLLEKLAQLQQEKDIREAGLDDLEECPFCDYKEILPPIEEDFEFRCKNPDCEQVSCRKCKSVSHIPISCEEHAKDSKGNSRRKVEEAMTAALIRSCKKCNKQFIKQDGCNKMRCPSCGNLQCYVCSTTIQDYNHFDQSPSGAAQGGPGQKKCPLYDNVEERHEREVKEAEEAARADVLRENPDLSEQDLEIKVSDAVKRADADRIRRADVPGGRAAFAADADDLRFMIADAQNEQMALRQRIMQQQQQARLMANRINQHQFVARAQPAQGRREARAGAAPQQLAAPVIGGQQVQPPQQPAGLMGAVQGYIPVLFNPPAVAPAPAPQPRQNIAGQPQPQQDQAQAPGVFRGRQGRFGFNRGNPFNFGGDGAADFDVFQQPNQANLQDNRLRQPNHVPMNNNGVTHDNNPFGGGVGANRRNDQPPGAWQGQQQPARIENFEQQLRDLEAQNIRRLQQERMLRDRAPQNQAMQAVQARQAAQRIGNPAANQHYEDYQWEMRRNGGRQPW